MHKSCLICVQSVCIFVKHILQQAWQHSSASAGGDLLTWRGQPGEWRPSGGGRCRWERRSYTCGESNRSCSGHSLIDLQVPVTAADLQFCDLGTLVLKVVSGANTSHPVESEVTAVLGRLQLIPWWYNLVAVSFLTCASVSGAIKVSTVVICTGVAFQSIGWNIQFIKHLHLVRRIPIAYPGLVVRSWKFKF